MLYQPHQLEITGHQISLFSLQNEKEEASQFEK
jgi:hypothetical protein